ncbi:MAG: hypothetical protein NTU43_04890 [Bacteroidetes bacterium]|nr:hypothetical protein [Bacteroidota bacterium]
MKKHLTLLILFIACFLLGQAQPKINRATPTPTTVAPVKPKGPVPYLLKKDFDDILIGLKSDISKATSSNNSLRNSIASKDAQINKLAEDIKKVEEVLNLTNMEIENTSDSLSKTRYSLEELQKMNDTHFQIIENTQSKTNDMMWMILGIGVVIAFLISLLFNFLTNKKVNVLKSELIMLTSKTESTIEAKTSVIKTETQELIHASNEQQQFYTERWANSSKTEILALKTSIESLAIQIKKSQETIANIENELKPKTDINIDTE